MSFYLNDFLMHAIDTDNVVGCQQYINMIRNINGLDRQINPENDTMTELFVSVINYCSSESLAVLYYMLSQPECSETVWHQILLKDSWVAPEIDKLLRVMHYGYERLEYLFRTISDLKTLYDGFCKVFIEEAVTSQVTHMVKRYNSSLFEMWKYQYGEALLTQAIECDNTRLAAFLMQSLQIRLKATEAETLMRHFDIFDDGIAQNTVLRRKLRRRRDLSRYQLLALEYMESRFFHLRYVIRDALPLPEEIVDHVVMQYVDLSLSEEHFAERQERRGDRRVRRRRRLAEEENDMF